MITREITRVDFVKQPDGSVTFCVGVTEAAPDPFNEGQVIRRAAEPNPMTPQTALERFGFALSDIVAGINEAMAAENAAKAARIVALEAEKAELLDRCAALEAELAAQAQTEPTSNMILE